MVLLLAAALAATPAAVEEYSSERWLRSSFSVVGAGVVLTERWDPKLAPVEWAVFDGGGHMVSAEDFAAGAHDRGMQARFDREEDKAKGTNTALTVVALLITAGAGFADNDGSLGPTDTVPQPGGAPDSSPVWVQIVNHRTVDHYYTLEVADELIRAHNASLRRHLGLTLEEAQAQDARPVAAPAP